MCIRDRVGGVVAERQGGTVEAAQVIRVQLLTGEPLLKRGQAGRQHGGVHTREGELNHAAWHGAGAAVPVHAVRWHACAHVAH
eukprot:5598786-Prymnesium_polylepis.1